jgi:hypothetical protein
LSHNRDAFEHRSTAILNIRSLEPNLMATHE